jgi:predicted peptidase
MPLKNSSAALLRVIVLCGVSTSMAACTSTPRWPVEPGQHPQSFQTQVTKTARFLLHVPADLKNDGRKWPLIVFLHGSGESGSDLNLVKKHGPPMLAELDRNFPFIVVSPQADAPMGYERELLAAMLDEVVRQLPVDETRIYLTGLSMGGYATWAWATMEPERFAAIAPICGGWDPAQACKLKNVPIWAFHGAKDDAVPIAQDQAMVDAVKACGGDIKFTVYPDVGHDSWTQTYANPELFAWFLSHQRPARQP